MIRRRLKMDLLLSIAEECDTKERLSELLSSGQSFTAYNGFEPSGRIHIAQAVTTVLNANIVTKAGGRFIIYIADWFAQINGKMGGDLDKIKEVGQYFIEVFKAMGLNQDQVEFVWASDFIAQHPSYWPRVLDISSSSTLNRVKKCLQIMGRSDSESLNASQILYPCMQAADIFELVPGGVDICQLGVDQRKVNMLAIEYAHKKNLKIPISLCHHMVMGLDGKDKMSKSNPDAAIFMDDSEEEIKRKIMKAFCPDTIEANPTFDYLKHLVFRWYGGARLCGRDYLSIQEVEVDLLGMNKKELKEDLARLIWGIVKPVHERLNALDLVGLTQRVASYRVTK